ncbi:cytosolic Fe-S cluster assembly factor NUBP2 homolog [Corticium candelabrum]|uniref:cytosolic Fe-S cluster assembly factor NUBP2 homolog n=1 Tax=Corticium candelabrum TaxID=121492 RepID=UPI002E273782|nr:cytosolic Fe-S cluster assembly factor NUBP2 homolog [Corticium candelabrum]
MEGVVCTVGCPSNAQLAGRAPQCEGCPGRALCQTSVAVGDPDQELIDCRMNAIRHKILILSGKGGVGKSTIAAALSLALSRMSFKVGLLDVDICGPSIPQLMGVQGQTVVNSSWGWMPLKSPIGDVKVISVGSLLETDSTAIVWRGPRKTALIKRFLKDTFFGRLDCLVVDTPPGTSDEHLTIVKLLNNVNPDGAVIVTTPQKMALYTIKKELDFCRKLSLPVLGIVENMSSFICPCCEENSELFPNSSVEKFAEEHCISYLGRIPVDPNLARCCEEGSNVEQIHPLSPSVKSLKDIAKHLQIRLMQNEIT